MLRITVISTDGILPTLPPEAAVDVLGVPFRAKINDGRYEVAGDEFERELHAHGRDAAVKYHGPITGQTRFWFASDRCQVVE